MLFCLIAVYFLFSKIETEKVSGGITGLKVVKIGFTSAYLEWAQSEISDYQVYYKAVYEQSYHAVNVSTNYINIYGLDSGTSHEVIVRTSLNQTVKDDRIKFNTKFFTISQGIIVIEKIKVNRYSINLSWHPVPGTLIYHVAYREEATKSYRMKYVTKPSTTLTQLTASTLYYIKIQVGHSTNGHSKWSELIPIITKPGPPSEPISLRVCDETRTALNKVNLLLCWLQPKELAEIHQNDIYYSINWCNYDQLKIRGCYNEDKILHNTAYPSSQTFVIKNVDHGSSIWFRVTSYAADGMKGGEAKAQYDVTEDQTITTTKVVTSVQTSSEAVYRQVVYRQEKLKINSGCVNYTQPAMMIFIAIFSIITQ